MERHRKGGAPAVTPTVTPAVTLAHSGNNQGNNAGKKAGDSQRAGPSSDDISIQPGETVEDAAPRLIGEIDMDMSFDEARRMKEVYLVLLNRLEYEQKSGSLVELDTASAILFEEFRAQRDAWLNWPAKIAPLVAAELGVTADKVTTVLTDHVHKQISQLGDPEANFSER